MKLRLFVLQHKVRQSCASLHLWFASVNQDEMQGTQVEAPALIVCLFCIAGIHRDSPVSRGLLKRVTVIRSQPPGPSFLPGAADAWVGAEGGRSFREKEALHAKQISWRA